MALRKEALPKLHYTGSTKGGYILESKHIEYIYLHRNESRTALAKDLGVSRRTFYNILEREGISLPRRKKKSQREIAIDRTERALQKAIDKELLRQRKKAELDLIQAEASEKFLTLGYGVRSYFCKKSLLRTQYAKLIASGDPYAFKTFYESPLYIVRGEFSIYPESQVPEEDLKVITKHKYKVIGTTLLITPEVLQHFDGSLEALRLYILQNYPRAEKLLFLNEEGKITGEELLEKPLIN